MMLIRTPHIAALTVAAALAVDAPAPGACSSNTAGQGRTGGTANYGCVGAGLSFIGPSSDVHTVIGSTIITPAVVGSSIVSAGNVAIAP